MGYDHERLRILVGNSGLPPGAGEMMQLLNRGHITTDDFQRGVAESNLRNEWGPALEQLAQYVLTPVEYANLHLRGWITNAQMVAGGKLHGVTASDMQLLFEGQGRPITLHQIVTGEARGGSFNGSVANLPPEYLTAAQQSSIRPEWFNLDYANRYTYPGAFFFRLLIQSGQLTATQGEQAFLELGWDPKWAKLISQALAGKGAAADPHIAKAQTQLWTQIHKSYAQKQTIDVVRADTELTTLISSQAVRKTITDLWTQERALATLG
jgi:hypothetical protein